MFPFRVPPTRWLSLFMLAVSIAACGSDAPLPTAPDLPEGVDAVCELALLEGILHGDPRDSRLVWLIVPTGVRRELRWPYGFTARFSPQVEVVAPDGEVVAKEGDDLDLGGGFRPDTSEFGVCEVNGRLYLDE